MTGLVAVAVYCVAVVVLVLALARFAEWSVAFWEDDPQTPAWLVVGWHRWRFHTITRTANGDVVCWSCTRPLVWARRSESWAWTPDHGGDEPGLDAEYDLELHVADAMRVANEDDR